MPDPRNGPSSNEPPRPAQKDRRSKSRWRGWISRAQTAIPWGIVLAGFGVVLSLIALAVAWKLDARARTEMRRVADRLEFYAGTISTRLVGIFPDNVSDLARLVSGDHQTLEIMADFVGYGHYSA